MAIKVYHSAQNGAPALTGSAGDLIDVWDKVLVDGYGEVNISSIVPNSSIATVTCSVPHGFESGDYIAVSGATEAKYNGVFKVAVTSGTAFTYALPEALTTPATGPLKVRRAPAGFEKVFSADKRAVYRSKDAASTRACLQVIDTDGQHAVVRGFSSMDSISSGADPFPLSAQYADGLFVFKSVSQDSIKRPWVLVSDGKTFYFMVCTDASSPDSYPQNHEMSWLTGFGDFTPYRPSDPFAAFLAANSESTGMDATYSGANTNGMSSAQVGGDALSRHALFTPRGVTLTVGAQPAALQGHGWSQSALGSAVCTQYPHYPNNGFLMTPVTLYQQGCFRGCMPGLYEPMHGKCLGQMSVVTGVAGYPGRKFMALWGRNALNDPATGMVMVDITGDANGKWS